MTTEFAKTGNKREVLRNWPFPTPIPTRAGLIKLIQKFERHGKLQNLKPEGRPRSVLTPINAGMVEQVCLAAPKNSVRRTSAELGIPKSSVFRMLKDLNKKAFLPTVVQSLTADDFVKR